MQDIRKITSKTVGLKSEVGYGFQIVGRLRQAQNGMTDKGPFMKLKGMFEAYPYGPGGKPLGDTFRSTTAILPGVVEDQVCEVLKTAQDADRDATVLFAFDIFLAKAENAMGREWRSTALSNMAENVDPLAEHRKLLTIPSAAPALPKPSDAASAKPAKKK